MGGGAQRMGKWPAVAVTSITGNYPECYTPRMYAQKLVVDLVIGKDRKPCPLEWLDSFCMRNFTNSADFDDTLPTGEGLLEASFRVQPAQLATALAAWLNQRGKGNGQPVQVEIRKA